MKTVLVIEDDDVARELMKKALERRGLNVCVAENGLTGFDLALQCLPDLIVTDIAMPGADGVHLIRRIRDTRVIAHVPILVTTGFGSGSATYALTQGATAFEPKPLDPQSFMTTVDRLLTP